MATLVDVMAGGAAILAIALLVRLVRLGLVAYVVLWSLRAEEGDRRHALSLIELLLRRRLPPDREASTAESPKAVDGPTDRSRPRQTAKPTSGIGSSSVSKRQR